MLVELLGLPEETVWRHPFPWAGRLCVDTEDFMTADWVHIDPEVLATISTRIINEVPGINRVAYDISSKPPATIEWEYLAELA